MSQLEEIKAAQKTIEERIMLKMGELSDQIQCAGPGKDTVARVAEEFRTFRELIFSMLGLLRRQISEFARQVDDLDTRQRRKTVIFQGIIEDKNENCSTVILDVINNKMALKDISISSINACHRLGAAGKGRPRPIIIKFTSYEAKSAVWKSKTSLKGSKI